MNEPLISVIVPVYKVEQYLDKCINSIVNQTYKNLEIILVDDGSPDKCPQMCDEWAKKDSRIVVIHKENGGLSDARNAGLEVATGEYISFVDSDDWLSLNFYEILLNLILNYCVELVSCSVLRVFEENIKDEKEKTNDKIYSTKEALDVLISGKNYGAVAWNKLYKKSLINDLRFPIGKLHEDEFFTYKVISRTKKVVHTTNCCYYYRQREGSIMNCISLKHLDVLKAYKKRNEFLGINFPDLYLKDKFIFLNSCIYYGSKIKNSKKIVLSYANEIKFSFEDMINLGLKRSLIVIKNRIILFKIKYFN